MSSRGCFTELVAPDAPCGSPPTTAPKPRKKEPEVVQERAQPLQQLEPTVEHDLAAVPSMGQATKFVKDQEHVALLAEVSWKFAMAKVVGHGGVDMLEQFVADGLGLHPVLSESAELAMIATTVPGPCEKIVTTKPSDCNDFNLVWARLSITLL